MKEGVQKGYGMIFFFSPSGAAGVTILALVYVNSQLEHAGECGQGAYQEEEWVEEEGGILHNWKVKSLA